MKYIFILYAFDITKVSMLLHIVGKTLYKLTLTKTNMHPNLGGREYVISQDFILPTVD
jgi:hypothetical protein